MPRKRKPALERAARALCDFHGLPQNVTFEGKPMWQSYLPLLDVVMEAIEEGASEEERRVVEGWR